MVPPSHPGRPAKTLQEAVTKLGPCFIKLAQTLSMRPDLVGEAYAESLSELQASSKQQCGRQRGRRWHGA